MATLDADNEIDVRAPLVSIAEIITSTAIGIAIVAKNGTV
jgi:hypothetical protein